MALPSICFLPGYPRAKRQFWVQGQHRAARRLWDVRGLGKQTLLYPDKLMRVRYDHDWILPGYAEVLCSAPEVHERVVAKSKSSAGQNGVSGSDIKAQPFALPPPVLRRLRGEA